MKMNTVKLKSYAWNFYINWKDGDWWRKFIALRVLPKIIFRKNDGDIISNEKWDSMIILDDCRYDIFKLVYNKGALRGRLEYRVSRGTATPVFLKENFCGDQMKFKDVIYITANPFTDVYCKNKFYMIISVWKDGWSDVLNNISPLMMYYKTLVAIKKFPNKRIIVHFMQPHSPYPNKTGEINFNEELNATLEKKNLIHKYKIDNESEITWPYISFKALKISKLIQGYVQNFLLVLSYVDNLIDYLPGKTVVTSDHGEAFGERIHPLIPFRFYGHFRHNIRIPVLIKVPWLIIDSSEKKNVNINKELIKIRIKKLNLNRKNSTI